jgi:hypothetical protein
MSPAPLPAALVHLRDHEHAQAVLSEPELLRAMFDVGYFPPNAPPGE